MKIKQRTRLRRIDMRYNDGIKDLALKIKNKALDIANWFKQSSKTDKAKLFVRVLLKIAAIAALFYEYKGYYEYKNNSNETKEAITGVSRELKANSEKQKPLIKQSAELKRQRIEMEHNVRKELKDLKGLLDLLYKLAPEKDKMEVRIGNELDYNKRKAAARRMLQNNSNRQKNVNLELNPLAEESMKLFSKGVELKSDLYYTKVRFALKSLGALITLFISVVGHKLLKKDSKFTANRKRIADYSHFKGDKNMRYYPVRHRNSVRHIDRCVMAVRHCDGIKDIAIKIREKAIELKNDLMSLPMGKRIAVILTKVAKLVATVFTAKTAADLTAGVREMNEYRRVLPNLVESWALNAANAAEVRKEKIFIVKQGVKMIAGLLGALAAHVAEVKVRSETNQ